MITTCTKRVMDLLKSSSLEIKDRSHKIAVRLEIDRMLQKKLEMLESQLGYLGKLCPSR